MTFSEISQVGMGTVLWDRVYHVRILVVSERKNNMFVVQWIMVNHKRADEYGVTEITWAFLQAHKKNMDVLAL